MDSISEVNVLLESKNPSDIQKAKDILAKVSSSELKQLITQRTSAFSSLFKLFYEHSLFVSLILNIPIILFLYIVMAPQYARVAAIIVAAANLGLFFCNRMTLHFIDKSRIRIFVNALIIRNSAKDISTTLYILSKLPNRSYRGIGLTELQRAITRLLVSQAQACIGNGCSIDLTSDEMNSMFQIVRNNSRRKQTTSNLIFLKLIEIHGSPVELPLLRKLMNGLLSQSSSTSKRELIPATQRCISIIGSREIVYWDRETLLRSSEDANLLLQSSSALKPLDHLLKPSTEQLQTTGLDSE